MSRSKGKLLQFSGMRVCGVERRKGKEVVGIMISRNCVIILAGYLAVFEGDRPRDDLDAILSTSRS